MHVDEILHTSEVPGHLLRCITLVVQSFSEFSNGFVMALQRIYGFSNVECSELLSIRVRYNRMPMFRVYVGVACFLF